MDALDLDSSTGSASTGCAGEVGAAEALLLELVPVLADEGLEEPPAPTVAGLLWLCCR